MDAVAANFEQVHRPALPAESPLDMPVQSLWGCSKPRSDRARLPSAPRGMVFRRLLVIGGAVLLTAAAANEMYKVLTAGTLTVLAILVLLLFVVLFAWNRASIYQRDLPAYDASLTLSDGLVAP
jgi:membrane glycosyltransferase